MLLQHLQDRMNVVDRAMGLPLLPLHSRIQADTGCSYLSLTLAGTVLWDRIGP